MIKQHQISQNDCFSACLASILHVPVESVPYFYIMAGQDDIKLRCERFFIGIDKWLTSFNLKLQLHPFNKLKNIPSHKYFIGCDRNHAFVCKNQKVIFDPYPTKHICVCYSKYNLCECKCKTHYGSKAFVRKTYGTKVTETVFVTGILYGFDLIKRDTIRPKRKAWPCNFGKIQSLPFDYYNESTKQIVLYN